MCEETDREGRGLENKWIYVLLLFAILDGQSKRAFLFKIIYFISRFKKKEARVVFALQVNSSESTGHTLERNLDAACKAKSRGVLACKPNVSY